MNEATTKVASAMAERRAPKHVIREQWCDVVGRMHQHHKVGETLYVTLCGPEAIDIKLLIKRGFIPVEENGAISSAKQPVVIAIEKDVLSAATLKTSMAGLYVVEATVDNAMRGETLLRFPDGVEKEMPRARVINLDYNSCLDFHQDDDKGLRCSTIENIRKIAIAHSAPPVRHPWALLLTLRGDAGWGRSTDDLIFSALAGADRLHAPFNASYSPELQELLTLDDDARTGLISDLDLRLQQEIVRAYVALRVAQVGHATGWAVSCSLAWRYGGDPGANTAPMCTWAFEFEWSEQALNGSASVLDGSLATCLAAFGDVPEEEIGGHE